MTNTLIDADTFAAEFHEGVEKLPGSRRFTPEQLEVLYGLGYAQAQQERWDKALAIFDAPLHIPVAREILGGGEALFLRRLPVITAAKVGRALPESAVLTLVNVKRAIHQNMALGRHCENSKM